jgi:hypothetical protein
MSHHSSHDDGPLSDAAARKEMSEAMSKIFGEFPDGKLNVADEGALSVMIGHEKGRVVIRFPKPVEWIGFTPEQALGIAETLINHARRCGSTIPLVLRVGGSR